MGSKALTISFLASGGIHLALLGGLMVTGYQMPTSAATPGGFSQTTIDFASIPLADSIANIPALDPRPTTPPQVNPLPSPKTEVAPPLPLAPEIVQPEPQEVKLGIDDGNLDSKNWIGSKDPTEFRAPKSPVDQAEVAINPGNASLSSGAPGKPGPIGAPGVPGQAAPADAGTPALPQTSNPQPATTSTPSDVKSPEPKPAPSASEAMPAKGDGPNPVEPQEKIDAARATPGKPDAATPATSPFDRPVPPVEKGVENANAKDTGDDTTSREAIQKRDAKVQGSPSGSDKSAEEIPAQPTITPPSVPAPAAAPTPSPSTEQGNQGHRGNDGNNASGATVTGDKPGEKDDREADASAVIDSVEVIPGKPAAAKGLRIQTSRPQWSMATKLTARPRNPTVRITFGPTGRVAKAEFVTGKSSGYVDVDQPLLNAVYRWTARGEAIDKLNPANPKSGVTITVNILLN